jgi:predicted XRE-type DNA-binding protein
MKKKAKIFREVLAEIESPQDIGQGSWALPENATPLEKTKHELCKQILIYKQDNNLSTEEIAKKINLTNSETQDILFYHIDYFTLDRLMTYADRLLAPAEVKVIVEPRKITKTSHAPVV